MATNIEIKSFNNKVISAELTLVTETVIDESSHESTDKLLSGVLVVQKYIGEDAESTKPTILPCLTEYATNKGYEQFAASSITKVVIKEGITETAAGAFKNCINLTEIELPKSLTLFGADSFEGCNSEKFTKVLYHGSLATWLDIDFIFRTEGTKDENGNPTYNYHYYSSPMTKAHHFYLIDNSVAASPVELTSLEILEGTTELKPFIFAGFKAVTTVSLPSTLIKISNQAFWGCTSLSKIEVPRAVTSVGALAFDDCYGLSDIYFCNNKSLTLGYAILNSCGKPADEAAGTKALPVRLHFEGNAADFNALSKDKNWQLESFIEFVYGPAKYTGCTESGLCWQQSYNNEIAIVGYDKELLYKEPEENEPYNWESIKIGEGPLSESIYEYFLNINIPEKINECNVTQIKSYAFTNCYKANIINIPATVIKIEDYAFYCCGNLMIFNVHSSNTIYKTETCSGAIDIKNSYNYSYLTDKTDNIIRYCTGAPNTTFYLKQTPLRGAFADSLNLETIIIDSPNLYFYENAFCDCKNLKEVILSTAVTPDNWAEFTFENSYANPLYYAKRLLQQKTGESHCSEIAVIELTVLPKDYTFYNCESLTALTLLTEGLPSITDHVAEDGSNILYVNGARTSEKSDVYGDTILYVNVYPRIGKLAFCGCRNLKTITLPNTILDIGESAFLDCHNITTVTYQGDFTNWCESFFDNKYSNPLFYDVNHTYNNKSQYQIINNKSFDGGTSDSFWNKEPSLLSTTNLANLTQIPDCTFFASADMNNPISISKDLLGKLLNARIIGEHAFEKCIFGSTSSDIAIEVTDNQYIGKSAFKATNITTIKINGKNIILDDFAFADLESQGNLNITSNTENLVLNDGCFNNSHFRTIIIPARYLSEIDLSDCKELTIIEDGTVLPATIFYQATRLESLTFEVPAGIDFRAVEKLTSESFRYCKNFRELKLNSEAQTGLHYTIIENCLITADGELIFGANEANIANIEMPISIKDRAFAYRTFGSIPTLPKNTVAIGRDIFYNATIPTKSE